MGDGARQWDKVNTAEVAPPLAGVQRSLPATTEDRVGEAVRVPAGVRRAYDVGAVAALGLVSYLVRRGGLPVDGLWFDDSWVATGAIRGHPRGLLVAGSGHPGFTALLMAVNRIGSGSFHDLGVPSLLAGIAGPVALYLALRKLGYERAISTLVGAALAVAPIHILYSGRVKGYTLDTLVVIVLMVAVPLLARRTWRWPLAVGWTLTALAISTLSGYLLLATAGAAVVLALHPSSDRMLRYAAVAVQAAAQVVYLRMAQSRTNLASVERVMEDAYDGHMTFHANPIELARESMRHLRRVIEVYPGGSSTGWLTVVAVVAMVGLVAAAVRGTSRNETVAARFLLLVMAMAFVGAMVNRFPFGPTNDDPISAGGRHALWMVPAVAFGLAAAAHRLRALVGRDDELRLGFDALAVGAAVVLVFAAYAPAPLAPFPGSLSATRYIEAERAPGDVVIIGGTATFAYAINTDTPVNLRSTPTHEVGFAPIFEDPDIHVVGPWAAEPTTEADILEWVADADRVFAQGDGPLGHGSLDDLRRVLEREGFTQEVRSFGWSRVDTYTR